MDASVGDLAMADLGLAPPAMLGAANSLTACLALDDQFVYLYDEGGAGHQIIKAPKTPGGASSVVAIGGDQKSCVVVDDTSVYFSVSSTDADAGTGDTIYQAAKTQTGGAATPILTNQHVLGRLEYASGFLYWMTDVYGPGDGMFSGKDALVRLPTGGGPVEVLFADVAPEPVGLAVDATTVYWSDGAGVFSRPLNNTTATPTRYGVSTIHGNAIAIDELYLALVEISAIGMGDVATVKLDGSGRQVVSTTLASAPLAAGAEGIYAKQDNHLVRFSRDGATTTTLATAAPRALALDATAIYFTDGAALLKLAR